MMSVREVLITALEDDSELSTDAIKSACARLLTQIGVLTKNSETLLMAAKWAKKLKIDIQCELE